MFFVAGNPQNGGSATIQHDRPQQCRCLKERGNLFSPVIYSALIPSRLKFDPI